MAAWAERRAQFIQQFTTLGQYIQNQMPTDIQNLTNAMAQYVQAGGVSNDPSQDPNYATIVSTSQAIQAAKTRLQELNGAVSNAIRSHASNNDINGLLSENGLLQQAIQDRQQTRQATEADAKAAELRDDVLRTREYAVSKHQLFLLGRPLRPGSIPYLWALAALFVGLGLLGIAMAFPSITLSSQLQDTNWMDTMSQPMVWGSVLGSCAIIILFMALNTAGVFKAAS